MVFISDEKRRSARVKLQSPMHYQVLGRPETGNAIADNISLGGTGFTNNQFIVPATVLSLEITFWSNVLNLRGRVTWSSPLPHSDWYRSGIEFMNLEEKDKNLISDYIDLQMLKI